MHETMKLKIDEKGQIKIPPKLLEAYPVRDGDNEMIFETIPQTTDAVCIRRRRIY